MLFHSSELDKRKRSRFSCIYTVVFLTVILLAILVGFLTFMALMSTCIFSSLFYIFCYGICWKNLSKHQEIIFDVHFLHLRARLVCFNKVILLNILTDLVSVFTSDCLLPRKQVQLLWGDLEFSCIPVSLTGKIHLSLIFFTRPKIQCAGIKVFLSISELPFGWEEVNDKVLGKYFIDHNTGKFLTSIFILCKV